MSIFHSRVLAALSLAASLLSGCGGGDSNSDLTLRGTAATGAAIAGGTVTFKCVVGSSAPVSTAPDGSYLTSVAGGVYPCIGRVEYTDADGAPRMLHTIATGAGTVNITPLTELMLASLTGGSAADAFDNFDPVALAAYTPEQIQAANDAVRDYLENTLGVDVSNLPDDLVGTAFVAQNGDTDGDDYDLVLDDLAAKLLDAGMTLDDAVIAISTGGDGGDEAATGGLTVSDASNSDRNGDYAPTGAKFSSGANSGFNGRSADGKFEIEVVWDADGNVLRAHIWFFDDGDVIKFFGCDSQGIPCTGVAYDAALDELSFSDVAWQEVTPSLDGSVPDVLVPDGESLLLNGTLSLK